MIGRQHDNAYAVSAYEVLPADLVDKLIEEHGGTFRVTFSPPGKKPNRSEGVVPKKFRAEVRKLVDAAKGLSTRSIYFGGHKKRRHTGGADEAQKLADIGFSRQAITAALGVTSPTTMKWLGKGSYLKCELDLEELPAEKRHKLMLRGAKRCAELGIVKSAYSRDTFHVEVGWAMAVLKKWAKDATEQG